MKHLPVITIIVLAVALIGMSLYSMKRASGINAELAYWAGIMDGQASARSLEYGAKTYEEVRQEWRDTGEIMRKDVNAGADIVMARFKATFGD